MLKTLPGTKEGKQLDTSKAHTDFVNTGGCDKLLDVMSNS